MFRKLVVIYKTSYLVGLAGSREQALNRPAGTLLSCMDAKPACPGVSVKTVGNRSPTTVVAVEALC